MKWVGWLIGVLFIVSFVSAKDLYVDQHSTQGTCSDAYTYAQNNISRPWCTIGTANTLHQSGDHVYILPGEYREQILPKTGIDATHRTVYSGYGDRSLAKIIGSNEISNATWTLYSGSIYSTPFASAQRCGGTYVYMQTSCFEDRQKWYFITNDINVFQPGMMYYNGSQLFVWSYSGTPATHKIECSVRDVGPEAHQDNRFLIIQNLTFMHSQDRPINLGDITGYVDILNNEIEFNAGCGSIGSNSAAVYTDKYVNWGGYFNRGNYITNINVIGNSIHDQGSDRGPGVNVSSYYFQFGIAMNWADHGGDAIKFYTVKDGIIANNTIYNTANAIGLKGDNVNILVQNNTIHDFAGTAVVLGFTGTNNVIEDNFIYNGINGTIHEPGLSYPMGTNAVYVDALEYNDTIRHNTFWFDSSSNKVINEGVTVAAEGTGDPYNEDTKLINVYNNIVYTNPLGISNFTQAVWLNHLAEFGFVDNNIYFNPITTMIFKSASTYADMQNINYNLQQWKTITHLDQSSIESNPLLINPPSNIYLQNVSPAINKGTFVSGYHCAQSDDVNPNQVNCRHWCGSAPDIGAVEYCPNISSNNQDWWGSGIAKNFPGDINISNDPRVLFHEDFQENSIATMASRWTEPSDTPHMIFASDVPTGSVGNQSLQSTFIAGTNSGGYLYKLLPAGLTKLFVRFYIKLPVGSPCPHHLSQIGGTNPPQTWAGFPTAAPPGGTDWFSTRVEMCMSQWEWSTYSYWMGMHASGDGGYWGNYILPQNPTIPTMGVWHSVEMMVKLNNPVSDSNGESALWIDGIPQLHQGKGFPNGTWIWDYFTNGNGAPFEGYQWRNTSALNITFFKLEYYRTDASGTYSAWFDDVVVATDYIGPLTPVNTTQTCSLPYDQPTCNCINTTELNNAIGGWYTDAIKIPQLMSIIRQWKVCSS